MFVSVRLEVADIHLVWPGEFVDEHAGHKAYFGTTTIENIQAAHRQYKVCLLRPLITARTYLSTIKLPGQCARRPVIVAYDLILLEVETLVFGEWVGTSMV